MVNPGTQASASRWRSLLFVPAHQERFVARAHERGADAVILDLEDAVPADAKPAARAALEERGLRRILCEGGPHLFADMVRATVADELCLSVSPLLTGPGSQRISSGEPWQPPAPVELTLTGLLEEDGALFCRYRIPH